MVRAQAVATLLLASTVDAQLNIPTVADGTCDLGTFYGRIVSLNGVCCFEAAGNPGARCTGVECNVACAAQLLPLLHDCHAIVDKMFDSDDGVEDGIASQFDTVYDACLHIDTTVALQALRDLQSQGLCTDKMLDGAGETAVAEAPCEDGRDGCDALIASGFMTCAADFAPAGRMAGLCDRTCAFCDGPAGPPPPCDDQRDGCAGTIATGFVSCEADFCPTCPMESQCDKTCGLCTDRHRLQAALQCDLRNFEANTDLVTEKCCDDGVSCGSGVPTTCDAKCAMTFLPFYDQCSGILANMVDPTSMASFTRLYETCSTGMPVEPLLRAAAECSQVQPEPEPEPTSDTVRDNSHQWIYAGNDVSCTEACEDYGGCDTSTRWPELSRTSIEEMTGRSCTAHFSAGTHGGLGNDPETAHDDTWCWYGTLTTTCDGSNDGYSRLCWCG